MDPRQRLKDLAISDTGFVFDPMTGITSTVNPTGRFILLQLKEGATVEQVEEALRGAFDLVDGDDPHRDVREFVLVLREQGLLPRDGDGAPAEQG
jgi:hypothetical protein